MDLGQSCMYSCTAVLSHSVLFALNLMTTQNVLWSQAQFADVQLAAYIPTDILNSGGFSAEMDLNDVMVSVARPE